MSTLTKSKLEALKNNPNKLNMLSIYGFFSSEDEDVTKEKNIMKTTGVEKWHLRATWIQREKRVKNKEFRMGRRRRAKAEGGGEAEEARGEHKYNTYVLIFPFRQRSEDRIGYKIIL